MPSTATAPDREPAAAVEILGIRVHAITSADAIRTIVARAAQPGSPPAYVVKPYVEFFDADDDVIDVLNSAWLSLPDGVALQWAAAYERRRSHSLLALLRSLAAIVTAPASLADPLPERFAGVSFTLPLLAACRDAGVRVFLVGSPKRQSIEATARHLEEHVPGLRILGTAPGRGPASRPEALLNRLRDTRPDVVLVGTGFPRQERLIAALAPGLDHGVLIGEGGTFDYRELGGAIPRAPAWVRRLGLEWLWRLGREPSRLGRQLAIPRFIWRVHRSVRA